MSRAYFTAEPQRCPTSCQLVVDFHNSLSGRKSVFIRSDDKLAACRTFNVQRSRRGFLSALALLALIATNACLLKASKPDLPRIFPSPQITKQTGKPPIIIIPGITGSELVNQKTGEKLWPELFPKDKEALALPITSTTLSENRDDITSPRVIESAQLVKFIPEIGVYGALLDALEKHGGYRRGDIDAPPPDGDRDTYYLFAYDWRRDNVESARKLAGKIAEIKRRTNKPDLRFDIIAHSMGGLIARYFAMYGDLDVLGGEHPQPDWRGAQSIGRLILFGTPNAGSMDALRSLIYGYSITEADKPRINLFRSLGRSMIFTAPSVYQLLPRNQAARFYDAKLAPIKLDIFDAKTWERYRWSAAFNSELVNRELKSSIKKFGEGEGRAEAEKTLALRANYLRAVLKRAAEFHQALDASDTSPEELRLHLVGGDCEPTLAGALIVDVKGETKTLFYPRHIPRKLRKEAFGKMFIPGDGRVTRQSLFGLTFDLESPEANGAITRAMKQPPAHTLFGCEGHGDLPINPTMMDNLLTLLLGNRY
ncbi:MAG: esterase/lipase family protein [Blastocatellales bacterium]